MSNGRIERAIEAAFKANPDGYFSINDLARRAYPDEAFSKPDRSQRVATTRAAKKVAKRVQWVSFRSWKRGQELIFANGLSLRSYGLGKVRAFLGDTGRFKDYAAEWVIHRLETDDTFINKMKPGGHYALAVEYHTAVANGDMALAANLEAKIEQEKVASIATSGAR